MDMNSSKPVNQFTQQIVITGPGVSSKHGGADNGRMCFLLSLTNRYTVVE